MNYKIEDIANILRAKSMGKRNYLLKDHLREIVNQAIKLKNFINKNKDVIKYNFNDEFFENLIIACFLHDLGKIDLKFQQKILNRKEKGEKEELNKLSAFFDMLSNRNIEIGDHEVISLIYSVIFLENSDWDKKIRTAILFHHYNNFYSNKDSVNFWYILEDYPHLKEYVEFLIKKEGEIKELLEKFIDEICSINDEMVKRVTEKLRNKMNFGRIKELEKIIRRRYDISDLIDLFDVHLESTNDNNNSEILNFLLFLGCLRRCDYAASSSIYIESENDISIELEKNLSKEVYEKLPENIKNSIGKSGSKLWQEKILDKYDSKNLILISPTGSGKTEFALLWAKNRGRKLIYTLPLRVAINDLYWRFGKGKKYFEEDNLGILHSTSYIEYIKEYEKTNEISVEEMLNSSRLFSIPVLLTTPDQILLASLKYYGFDKLLSIYPLSSIVIDEIQAYNPEMAAIIIKTIEMIKKLEGNILIITATYPPYFRKFLRELGFEEIDIEKKINAKELNEDEVKNYAIKRHKIKLISESIFEYEYNKKSRGYELKLNEESFNSEIINVIRENKSKSVMIIVNNVGKAIELYKKVREKGFQNVYLLHARLIEKEKSRRIEEIKQKLEKKERVILIATQIVEASVDVDFDILITEISPIDSQIQRWGRIYRNRENEGDYKDNEPNIIIFTGIDRGTSAIYDKRVIEKTIDILKEEEGKILSYKEEKKLIEKVFDKKINNENYVNKTLKEIYEDEIKKNLEWLKYFSAEKRSEAQRIFRRIAGIQVVVLELMDKSEDKIEKVFYGVIKDKKNWDLSWKEIEDKVKEKLDSEELKNKVNKWTLLKILYLYSFNLPIFFLGENYSFMYEILERKNLKGFFVLKKEAIENLDEIKEYGLDRIKNINIDGEEINQSEEESQII
ncbi:MAG: CRISPR-associated helicase Cas3' [Candidatus Aenigmatarchaeota archaeon]